MTEPTVKEHHIESNETSFKELILKIGDYWRYLLSNWKVILLFGLMGSGLGFLYAYNKKPVYTATTTFVLEEDKGDGMGSFAGLANIAGIDLGGSGGSIFQGDNILELYKSRKMIVKTLLSSYEESGKKHLLIDRYIYINHLKEIWNQKRELKGLSFEPNLTSAKSLTRIQDSILSTIVADINKNYLTVGKQDKKLSIVKADVKSKDEFFAKTFNNEIVRNVNDFYVSTKTKKSLENVKILQQKTDSVRSVMNGAIYSAAAVADATPNLNPTRQIQRAAPVQRSQFSAETNRTILGALVQNLEMSKISLRKEAPLIQVIDEPFYPLPMERFGKLKGIIFGGFLGGGLIFIILFLKKLGKSIMA